MFNPVELRVSSVDLEAVTLPYTLTSGQAQGPWRVLQTFKELSILLSKLLSSDGSSVDAKDEGLNRWPEVVAKIS